MLWRSFWPALPEAGEQPPQSVNYKFLRVVIHVPQNMALSLESFFIYLFNQVSSYWHSGLQDNLLCQMFLKRPEA